MNQSYAPATTAANVKVSANTCIAISTNANRSYSIFKKLLLGVFVVLGSIGAKAQIITVGGGGSITCPATPTATWSTPLTGITFSNWSRGSGVTCVSAGDGIAGSGFNTADAATSFAANKYFSVTISTDATKSFVLTSLTWLTTISSGGANFNVQYSNNGGPVTAFGTTGTSTTSNTFTGSVTVAAGTSIVLYLIPSGTGAAGTTLRWRNGSTITLAGSNNDCANAISLTPGAPGASCTTLSGTNAGATQSTAPITCASSTSSSALDVWYKFVATATSHTITASSSTDLIVDLRSGACNGSNIACADAGTSGAETITSSVLTIGDTYLVRVYGWNGAVGSFTICVTTPATCGAPTGLAVSDIKPTTADLTWVAPVIGTPATYDWEIRLSGAGGSGPSGLTASGSTTAPTVTVNDAGTLTAATTYTLYVRTNCSGGAGSSTWASSSPFTTTTPPPANDDCANAITLNVASGTTCSTPVAGTTFNATQSAPAVLCSSGTGVANDDVWYKFVATNTTGTIRVVGGSGFDAVVELRSGPATAHL